MSCTWQTLSLVFSLLLLTGLGLWWAWGPGTPAPTCSSCTLVNPAWLPRKMLTSSCGDVIGLSRPAIVSRPAEFRLLGDALPAYLLHRSIKLWGHFPRYHLLLEFTQSQKKKSKWVPLVLVSALSTGLLHPTSHPSSHLHLATYITL